MGTIECGRESNEPFHDLIPTWQAPSALARWAIARVALTLGNGEQQRPAQGL
jgi:hypothetical protein